MKQSITGYVTRIATKAAGIITGAASALAYGVVTIAALFLAATLITYAASNKPISSSIVMVTNNEATGGGTGWVTEDVDGNRVIVTNHHVCDVSSGDFVRIQDDSGKPSMKRILARDAARDLCVVEGVNAPTLSLAARGPRRFETINVYGHPFLNPTTPSSGQYLADVIGPVGFSPNADGECDAGEPMTIKGDVGPPNTIQPFNRPLFFGGPICVVFMELSLSTATIYPGNSGSPVTNADGDVVGVMNSAAPQDNRGNFIPLEYVREILGYGNG